MPRVEEIPEDHWVELEGMKVVREPVIVGDAVENTGPRQSGSRITRSVQLRNESRGLPAHYQPSKAIPRHARRSCAVVEAATEDEVAVHMLEVQSDVVREVVPVEVIGEQVAFPEGFSTEHFDIPLDEPVTFRLAEPVLDGVAASSGEIAEVAGFEDCVTNPGELAAYGVILGLQSWEHRDRLAGPDRSVLAGVRVVRPGSQKDIGFLER